MKVKVKEGMGREEKENVKESDGDTAEEVEITIED